MPGSDGMAGRLADVFDQIAGSPPAEIGATVAPELDALEVEGRIALAEDIARRARADLSGAERLAAVARTLLPSSSTAARARLLRSIGHVEALRSRLPAALAAYREALALFESGGHVIDAAVTRSGALQTLIYLGRYDEAYAWAASARAVFEAAADERRLARLETNLGNVLYRQDHFEEALRCYQRALLAFREGGDAQDVAIALRNRAVVEISIHAFDQAAATYAEARDWCERHGLTALVAEADYNIAYLFYQRGEYARAIELYRVARERCAATDDRYHQALCDLDQSELYLEINLVPEGVELARRAESGFGSLGLRYERAKALVNLATGAHLRGRAQAADRRFREARRMFVAEGNEVWPPLIDLYRALVLEHEAPARAERLCRGALAYFARTAIVSKQVLSELLLARLHLRAGHTGLTRTLLTAAHDRAAVAGLKPLAYEAMFLVGQCAEATGDEVGAIAAYRRAHALLDELRGGLRHDELKIAFLRDKQAVFERLVTLHAARAGGATDAFVWMEQSRARSLAEQIASQATTLPLPEALAGALGAQLNVGTRAPPQPPA